MFEIVGALTFLGCGLWLMWWVFHAINENYEQNTLDWVDWFMGVISLTIALLLVYYGADYFIGNLTWGKV